jgi:hypothetical protein
MAKKARGRRRTRDEVELVESVDFLECVAGAATGER